MTGREQGAASDPRARRPGKPDTDRRAEGRRSRLHVLLQHPARIIDNVLYYEEAKLAVAELKRLEAEVRNRPANPGADPSCRERGAAADSRQSNGGTRWRRMRCRGTRHTGPGARFRQQNPRYARLPEGHHAARPQWSLAGQLFRTRSTALRSTQRCQSPSRRRPTRFRGCTASYPNGGFRSVRAARWSCRWILRNRSSGP